MNCSDSELLFVGTTSPKNMFLILVGPKLRTLLKALDSGNLNGRCPDGHMHRCHPLFGFLLRGLTCAKWWSPHHGWCQWIKTYQCITVGWVTATEGVANNGRWVIKKMKGPASNALKISEDEFVVAILPLMNLFLGEVQSLERGGIPSCWLSPSLWASLSGTLKIKATKEIKKEFPNWWTFEKIERIGLFEPLPMKSTVV